MSYADLDRSREDSAPVHLYRFSQGEEVRRFAAIEDGFTTPAGTYDTLAADWEAAAITHSEITSSGDARRADITVTMPVDDAFAQRWISGAMPMEPTTLRILRADAAAPEAGVAVIWMGRVAGGRISGETIALRCENARTKLTRAGGTGTIQRICDHALYGPGCGLALDDYLISGTATGMTGTGVTVTEAALQADGYYAGGVLRYDGRSVHIRAHAGDALTLRALPYGLAEALALGDAAVEIAPGCDRSAEICNDRFDNILNRRAFEGIAGASIFGARSVI